MNNEQLEIIECFSTKLNGYIVIDDLKIEAEIERDQDDFIFRINKICDEFKVEPELEFISENFQFKFSGYFMGNESKISTADKTYFRYSEGIITKITENNWIKNKGYYCSYYYCKNHILFDIFENPHNVVIQIDNCTVKVSHKKNYLVLESLNPVEEAEFQEVIFHMLIALGFISGKFIQTSSFTFHFCQSERTKINSFKYRKLRPSSSSIYHAFTTNPYGYKEMIGAAYAKELFENNTLKPLSIKSFTLLINLSYQHSDLKYAFILFNEANGKGMSLLIRNNCFYAVLEILKKFFHAQFSDNLPKYHSSKGNIEKYKLVFNQLFPMTEKITETVRKRNVFLHGDIKNVSDEEMKDTMEQQITLIYRLVMTYIKFDGYILDHYALRKNKPSESFIKIDAFIGDPTIN